MRAHSLLRPLVFVAACFSVLGSAVAETFGNFEYTSDGTSVTIIRHANVVVPSIVVPAEINGLPVRTITALRSTLGASLALRGSVTSITIPEGVTTIGPSAISSFTALQSITLPNSVTSVGEFAFSYCTALTSASLGNGVTTLSHTFAGCTNLASIVVPNNVITLDYTFDGCSALANVTLPAGLIHLGPGAFKSCTSLENINFLPAGVLTIGDYAFNGCTGLTSLNFPAGLTSIGIHAFYNCTGMTSVVVPPTVTVIGDNAFWGCTNLTGFDLPDRFLASIASIGLDYNPELASDALEAGIADRLANNPDFIAKLADAIIAKNGHYGLSTQADITNVVNQTPQTVRDVIAEIGAGSPPVHGITSDLGMLTVKKGKAVAYAVTTTFSATAFAAIGLPDGVVIDSATGVISGKAKKAGTFNVFLHAGIPGGGSVSAVKVISVTP